MANHHNSTPYEQRVCFFAPILSLFSIIREIDANNLKTNYRIS